MKRSLRIFLISFSVTTAMSIMIWQFFFKETFVLIEQEPSTYEKADMTLPVQAFLYRGAQSENLSVVKRLFVNRWINNNQDDLAKLLVYAQSAKTFAELQSLLSKAIDHEGPQNGAISFVQKSLNAIDKNPEHVAHVNQALQKGFTAELQELRGQLANAVDPVEYKKLAKEYRAALDIWMDKEHGHLLDSIIASV